MVAVLVLYQRGPVESESFNSLLALARSRPELVRGMDLLVWDNSPEAHAVPAAPMRMRYRSAPGNAGLRPAYEEGLRMAREAGAEWLLLLDQDTVLTMEFLEELRSTLPGMPAEVGAVVPKLVYAKGVHSPHLRPRMSHGTVAAGFCGMAHGEVSAFNSGAAMRVSAVTGAGGFPEAFPMEYLDHAMFRALQAAGGRVWVMRSSLEHDLSTVRLRGEASLARYRRVLRAERDFYRSGGAADRAWYRLRRLKQGAGHLVKVADKRFALWDARAALGWLGSEDG